ncbi:hypothetical protein TthSNM11_24940 (plasmid) [Thermus thermophilus]|nr:hypothetical protein TthSNM11_24940 [Thermus thermophilus]
MSAYRGLLPVLSFTLLLFLASCQEQSSPPDTASYLLAVNAQDELWWVSLSTKPDIKVGPVHSDSQRVTGVFDLAWDGSSSTAWAVGDAGYTLYRLEVASGRATRVGSTGAFINALAVDPSSGRLFGLGGSRVYEVNPETGSAASIQGIQLSCGSSGDVAWVEGAYLLVTLDCGDPSGDVLAKVDFSTKQVLRVGTIGFSGVYGLSYKNRVLYGATAGGQLIRIDEQTGLGTLVRNLPFGVYGSQSLP